MENENTIEKENIAEENVAEKETATENVVSNEGNIPEEVVKEETKPEGNGTQENVEASEGVTENKDAVEKPRVLIVEDDETARISLKAALEAENIFVEAVENGTNAEAIIKYSSFDVVIVDYRLPDIDGLSLIKKMKIIIPDLMTLVVTAHTSVEIAVESMKMGAYDYMAKPLDIPNLVNTIYKILGDKKNLYDSRQKVTEMVTKKTVDYLFNDEKIAIISAPNPNILVEGNSKNGLFKSIKKFFVGVKNYYWGA